MTRPALPEVATALYLAFLAIVGLVFLLAAS